MAQVLKSFWVFSLLATHIHAFDTQQLAGKFLNENKRIEGKWFGGRNFTPSLCSRGFYLGRAEFTSRLDEIKMDLSGDNQLDISAFLSDAYGRVEGDYLGDYSGCVNASGWLGAGIESIALKAKVTMREDSPNVDVKVYYAKLGRLRLGRYCPEWLERFLTDSLNKALVNIWETRLGDWLNDYVTDYFNSIKDKRGL